MKLALFLLVIFGLTLNTYSENITPDREVEVFEDSIIITYNFKGARFLQDPLFPNAKFWHIPGFGVNEEIGKPSTLARWDSFVIPDGKTASIKIIDCEYCDTTFCLSPARQPLLNNDTTGYTAETVSPISNYIGFYPSNIIKLDNVQYYRGQKMQKVCISPIQYNHTDGIVRYFSKIKYCVNFNDTGNRDRIKNNIKISSFDYALNNIAINEPTNLKKSRNTYSLAQLDNRSYLIISVPEYEDAIYKFAEWKKTLGYNVHVALNDAWTKESVKEFITNLYNETENLYYILIIGDINDVPSYTESYAGYTYVTDLYYGCMDGIDDYIPDVYRGRIVVRTNEEASGVLNKIVDYERNPIIDDLFYNKGVHSAYFQDDNNDGYEDLRLTLTSEEILNYMQQHIGKNVDRIYSAKNYVNPLFWNNGDYSTGVEIPECLKKSNFAWDGDSTDIIEKISAGCFYFLMLSHGGRYYWVHPFFHQNSIQSLTNGNKQPIIFSMSCETGRYNYQSPCLAETFLKRANGGCVGIYAATRVTLAGYTDLLTSYMFDAIWPDSILRIKMPMASDDRTNIVQPIYRLGEILDISMNYLDEVKLSNNSKFHTRAVFHYFGDPSMMIRTETPFKFNPYIKRENGIITVNSNCEDTRISFYTPSTNNIDSYIGRYVEYNTTSDSVIVSLSKHNYIPVILDCNKHVFIQNDTITGEHLFVGENIHIGKKVTPLKEEGPVVIENGSIKINSKNTILNHGTIIKNSNMEINNSY